MHQIVKDIVDEQSIIYGADKISHYEYQLKTVLAVGLMLKKDGFL